MLGKYPYDWPITAWYYSFIKRDYQTTEWGAAGHLLGFEDEDLESSSRWWAATVATYCPSRPGGTTQIFKT